MNLNSLRYYFAGTDKNIGRLEYFGTGFFAYLALVIGAAIPALLIGGLGGESTGFGTFAIVIMLGCVPMIWVSTMAFIRRCNDLGLNTSMKWGLGIAMVAFNVGSTADGMAGVLMAIASLGISLYLLFCPGWVAARAKVAKRAKVAAMRAVTA